MADRQMTVNAPFTPQYVVSPGTGRAGIQRFITHIPNRSLHQL